MKTKDDDPTYYLFFFLDKIKLLICKLSIFNIALSAKFHILYKKAYF